MTVYDLGETDPALQRRTSTGRIKMLLVLAVCAAPVLASYLTYFLIKPESRTNYGTLIQPTRSLPEGPWHRLDGQPVATHTLKGQWLLVVVAPGGCDAACEKRLHAQRQLREMLGRDRDRLDKLWLISDGATPTPALLAAMNAPPEVTLLRADAATLAQWLQPEAGQGLADHLYLVDPMGEWMMRFPVAFEPSRVKRDIERLLRASASWDRAGR
jgi:cytochrome oxidase Cu insertion factor (SCO1/SenC/PrrC family)